MPQKIIIGLAGEIASGKDTAVNYLKEKYQAADQKFSAALRDILARMYLENTRENMQKLSRILRENFGQTLLSRVIAEDVKKETNGLVIINGVRRFTDIEYLKELSGFVLVYVTADIKIRYERLIKRSENIDDRDKTFQQFLEENSAEAEQEIASVGKSANCKITNNGTLPEFYRQLDEVIKNLKNKN